MDSQRIQLASAVALVIAFGAVEFSCGEAPAAQTGDMMGGASLLLAPKPAKEPELEQKAPPPSRAEPKKSQPPQPHVQLPWSCGHNFVF
jgi:hypothetical protein